MMYIPQPTHILSWISTSRCVGLALGLTGAIIFSGCSSTGPRSVAVDRFDYSTSIADSWKQQTLLNIVKLRYMDLPVFVDVASIVAGYSMQTGVSVGGSFSTKNTVGGDIVSAGAQAVYTDRPTITYVPMTGEKFLRALITPIEPKNIFFMLQTGYPADFILGLTVESLNGVRNRSTSGGVFREADPDFLTALQLLRDVQAVGAVGMRVEEDKPKNATGVLFFRRDDLSPEVADKITTIKRLLKLPSDQQKFSLIYSPVRGTDNELAVNSRSMFQIMSAFSTYMEVPKEHIADHSAVATTRSESGEPDRIHSGKDKPANCFASVYYRDHWFWIDDSDLKAKRALTAVIFFFTLADAGAADRLPLVTIPAQ